MKKLRKSSSLLLLICCILGINNFKASAQVSEVNIVSGSNHDIEDAPWQVFLYMGSYACGGSILDDNWILTAAHCLDGISAGSVIGLAGVTDIYDTSDPNRQFFEVAEVIVHPSYSPSNANRDIALIRLKNSDKLDISGKYAQKIEPIGEGYSKAGFEDVGTDCLVTGWGTLYEGGPASDVLQGVNVTIIARSSTNYPSHVITDDMFLAGFAAGKKDACQGDSGGPLATYVSVEDKWIQVGIVSWGHGCAATGYPGVYAKLSNFTEWIESETGLTFDGPSDLVSSTEEEELENNITVFPNPTSGQVNIKIEANFTSENTSIIINDLQGRKVFERDFSSTNDLQFDLSHLSKGLYTISINNGENHIAKKLMID